MYRLKIKKIFFILLLFVLLAGFTEISSIIIIKINPGITLTYHRNDVEGHDKTMKNNYFFRPHHYYAMDINPEYNNPHIPVNKYGLRSEDFALKKEPDEIRIACLGASTTQTSEGSYPLLLEKKLKQEYPDKKIRIINGGIGTYTTAETLIAYLFKISYMQPDLIIVYHGINDFFPETGYKDLYLDYRQHRKVWTKKIPNLPTWFFRFKRYSAFLQIINEILVPKAYGIWAYSLHKLEFDGPNKVNNPDFGKFFNINMNRLIKIALAEGTDVFLTTFIVNKNAPESWKIASKKYNIITRNLAKKHDSYLLNLEKILIESPPQNTVFLDNCHFTAFGNEWRTDIIIDFFKEHNIIDRIQNTN